MNERWTQLLWSIRLPFLFGKFVWNVELARPNLGLWTLPPPWPKSWICAWTPPVLNVCNFLNVHESLNAETASFDSILNGGAIGVFACVGWKLVLKDVFRTKEDKIHQNQSICCVNCSSFRWPPSPPNDCLVGRKGLMRHYWGQVYWA